MTDKSLQAKDLGQLAWTKDRLTKRGAELAAGELFNSPFERASFLYGWSAAYWEEYLNSQNRRERR